MKLKQRVMLTFLSAGLLMGVGGVVGTTFFMNREMHLQIYKQLRTVAVDRALRINSYIVERKVDAEVLSRSPVVRQVFTDEYMEQAVEVREEIQSDAERVAREVEGYLQDHPEMTLLQLQESVEFQAIAVQQVGQTGYTALTDYETLIARFHNSLGVVDLDLHNLAEKLPGFWAVMSRTEGGRVSSGFYDWKEADGTINQKYMYIEIVNEKTADGVGLSVAATAYVDEYGLSLKLAGNSVEYFTNFKELHGLKDLLLVNTEGDVLWSVERAEELGTNLGSGPFMETNLAHVYERVLASGEVIISDYELYQGGEPAAFLAVPASLDEEGDILGVIILEIDAVVISEIVGSEEGLGVTGEAYLVGQDGLMRSNSRFSQESSLLKQEITSENFSTCRMHVERELFDDEMNYSRGLMMYEGYRGVEVYGTHSHVEELDWCLLVDMEEREVLAPARGLVMVTMGVGAVTLFLFMLVANALGGKLIASIIKLREGVEIVEQGRLDYRVEVKSKDEVGELAESFNRMAEELGKSRANLEEKVAERTKTLEKTIDLMVDRELKMREMKKELEEASQESIKVEGDNSLVEDDTSVVRQEESK